jgi:hypothetical protein
MLSASATPAATGGTCPSPTSAGLPPGRRRGRRERLTGDGHPVSWPLPANSTHRRARPATASPIAPAGRARPGRPAGSTGGGGVGDGLGVLRRFVGPGAAAAAAAAPSRAAWRRRSRRTEHHRTRPSGAASLAARRRVWRVRRARSRRGRERRPSSAREPSRHHRGAPVGASTPPDAVRRHPAAALASSTTRRRCVPSPAVEDRAATPVTSSVTDWRRSAPGRRRRRCALRARAARSRQLGAADVVRLMTPTAHRSSNRLAFAAK